MRSSSLFLVGVMALTAAPRPTAAQEAERPAAFDTAGRIVSISPALATRLGLAPPAWPVSGDYVEARLFERTVGDFVIAVHRADGSVTRYPMDGAARRALADAVAAGMATTGGITAAERADLTSETAERGFARNQLIAGLLVYGPSVAVLAGGPSAEAAYFLTAGAAYFIASGIARSTTVNRAQNILATDGTWRGALIAQGIRYVIDPFDADLSAREVALLGLAGSLTGTVTGFQAGRRLTGSEAASATLGSTTAAALMTGAIGMTTGFEGGERAKVGAVVAGALAGYPLGLEWVRRAPYRVTTGDVSAQWTTALVGTLISASLLPSQPDQKARAPSAILTTGFLGGLVAGNRWLTRPYDVTDDQASSMRWSALAGFAIGVGAPILAKVRDERTIVGLSATGATLGLLAGWRSAQPRRASVTRR